MSVPLLARYSGLVCDLDGVVYRGPDPVPHAVEALVGAGMPVVYATNNASRTPEEVAAHLSSLGVVVGAAAVVTSSTAAATVLARRLPAGSPVLAVGGPGVAAALTEAGLSVVHPQERGRREPEVLAVVQGYGSDVRASDLAEAAYAIQAGARWIATNDDRTLPTARGIAPGNGSLVGAVRAAVTTDPEVVGKPHSPVYALAAERMGLDPVTVLAVGDRLETDIAGAVTTGMDGLLVLTGVHGWADAAAAPAEMRPRYVLTDLRELTARYPEPRTEGEWSQRGQARARWERGRLVADGEGPDCLRAGLDALWAAVDGDEIGPDEARAEMARLTPPQR